jgi:hypothetical protein
MNNQVRKKVSKLVYTYGIYLPTFFYSWIKPTFTNFYQLPTLVYKDKKNALLLPFARPYPLETVYLYANKARNSVHIINTIWTGKRNEVHI